MTEGYDDLWSVPCDARVITTNGDINAKGELVMGRGCALQAKQRYPWLPKILAHEVIQYGNQPYVIALDNTWTQLDVPIITMPVKHHWHERADLDLIVTSAKRIVTWVDTLEYRKVVMPRPGCGNGRLTWDVVKPLLAELLDDRFHVVTHA